MSRKYFLILGLFLVAGFLFLNVNIVKAAPFIWTGGGDRLTWTDPANWGNTGVNNFPGATTTDSVTIIMQTAGATGGGNVVIRATSTLDGTTLWLSSVAIGAAGDTGGPTLILGKDLTLSASTSVTLVGTSTLRLGDATWGSGNLTFANGGDNPNPFRFATTTSAFYAATGTVTFSSAATTTVATTTYYNLTLTSTSTDGWFNIFKFGANGNTCSTTTGCTATTTVTNAFTINAYAKADFNNTAVVLSGSGTVFSKANGTFVANGALVKYTNASAATDVASGTYTNLVISGTSIIKTLLGNTTATSTIVIESGTLAITTYTFDVSGSNYTNSDTVTRTTGKIVKASAAQFDDGSGTGKSSYDADARDSAAVQVTDTSLNFNGGAADTQSVTITATSGLIDSETVTLTETGNATGIFRGGVQFQLSGSDVSGKLDYQGPGTLSYAYTDSQDSSDTVSGTGNFTGTAAGGGGGGGGAVAATPAIPAIPATPATPTEIPATPATPATPAVPATPATPSFDNVQAKIASVVAKVAALTKLSPAADIAAVQAEIVAILNDIKAIQAAQPAPQGVALGFNFVRPLALGLSHGDVRKLQEALKTDSLVYPEGRVTGYFGSLTLKAVQKFQEKYGIASSGEPGYGNVGPKTREKLNELYGK
ncbi:MAG TPA: peptidoglycan-binding domain-containing protein [Candidatus Paceibacterota bacterium]